VEATTKLKCFVLARDRFVEILGPLYSLMAREKSPAVVTQRLMKLQTKVSPLPASTFLVQVVPAVSLNLAHHCRHAWVYFSGTCIKTMQSPLRTSLQWGCDGRCGGWGGPATNRRQYSGGGGLESGMCGVVAAGNADAFAG